MGLAWGAGSGSGAPSWLLRGPLLREPGLRPGCCGSRASGQLLMLSQLVLLPPSFRLSVSWLTAGGGQYCVIWAVLFNLLVPQRGCGESEAMLGMYGA